MSSVLGRMTTGIREVAILAVRVYVKAWMKAPQAECAPYSDLQMKSQVEYTKSMRKSQLQH